MNKPPNTYFYADCVSCPRNEVQNLSNMVCSSTDITRKTFLQHVDKEQLAEIETNLGYAKHPKQGLTMAADWHVSYHKGHFGTKRAYFFKHSAIEYIFLKEFENG